jgi:hypothetical protein
MATVVSARVHVYTVMSTNTYTTAGEGVVVDSCGLVGWVSVKWDNGNENNYQWGDDNEYDLVIVGGANQAAGKQVRRGCAASCDMLHCIPVHVFTL